MQHYDRASHVYELCKKTPATCASFTFAYIPEESLIVYINSRLIVYYTVFMLVYEDHDSYQDNKLQNAMYV